MLIEMRKHMLPGKRRTFARDYRQAHAFAEALVWAYRLDAKASRNR